MADAIRQCREFNLLYT